MNERRVLPVVAVLFAAAIVAGEAGGAASASVSPRSTAAGAIGARVPASADTPGQDPAPAVESIIERCAAIDDAARRTATDLRCVRLLPTIAGGAASGMVELGRVASPFGVALTPDGRQRYRLAIELEGVPNPGDLGPYTVLVAWAVSPALDEWVNLGAVGGGVSWLGEVALNKFTIMITAETAADRDDRSGPLLLRGVSPSSKMLPEDLLTLAPGAILPAAAHRSGPESVAGAATRRPSAGNEAAWWMPPTYPGVTPLPGLMPLRPDVEPWLPAAPDSNAVPESRPTAVVRLPDGGTLDLEAGLVRRTIGDRTFVMYGFNGQSPGPLIHVGEKSTIFVNFTNRIDWPTSIHWHGVRLDNPFDGVPGLTQDPVMPGETFRYRIFFRDAGIYWYHPHHREDVQQDLGLYGNMRVVEARRDAFGPVNREEIVMLDDLLVGERGLVPYGREAANFMLMGRFGNVFLVNGEPAYELDVRRGEVVRFFFTNASNTRTFNLTLRRADDRAGVAMAPPLPLKVVASDVGRFEREELVESVTLAPAERYAVDVRFPEAGAYTLANEVQAINHRSGRFFPEVAELGVVRVAEESIVDGHADAFETLRINDDVVADIDRHRSEFDRPVDLHLELRLELHDIVPLVEQVMSQDAVYFNPVEWAGTMPMMNWITSVDQVAWHLVEPGTGNRDMDIDSWRFRVGDVVKIRVTNSRDSFHAMHHPLHIHGQRFLVLEQDGVTTANLVWKDTVLLPVGSTTDLLLELSNPGKWMVHCHIAEHLESGMKLVLTVEE